MDEYNSPPSKNLINSDDQIAESHLTISEMAEKFGVTYRALRFYQQKGLLSPKRKGTTRLYLPRDVAHMKIIMDAKRTGLALTDVRDILRTFHKDGIEQQNLIVIDKLQNQEKLLEDQFQQISEQLT
jgi:DNA-binding transcriptional MerR regulator